MLPEANASQPLGTTGLIGSSDKHCVLTFVDRKTGYVMIGKLEARTVEPFV